MKFWTCAAAVVGAIVVGEGIASPVPAGRGKDLLFGQRRSPEEKKLTKEEKEALKYFHEPGSGPMMGHYDARYFHGVVSDEERNETQIHMIRAYLNFFRDKGLETWIAHGTLLGWWWNGKRLPWDWDMDTQVPEATLKYLGEHYNQTRHVYTFPDGTTHREYLLDVNPWIWERERGDGMNIIDARWIDVSNGLFIDITGLTETHPTTAPGTWVCKNYHRYKTSDLYPMRETIFEGVVAKVPYSYDKILIQEYKEKALVTTEFEGHVWDLQQRLWIKTPEQAEKDRKAEEERQKQREEEEKKQREEEEKQNAERKKAGEETEKAMQRAA